MGGFGSVGDLAGIPEDLVQVIEYVIQDYIRRNINMPFMGTVTKYNRKHHIMNVQPHMDGKELKNVPCNVQPYGSFKDSEAEHIGVISVAPTIGSQVLIGFVDGVLDNPYMMWCDKSAETLISSTGIVWIESPVGVHIKAPDVRINGSRIER